MLLFMLQVLLVMLNNKYCQAECHYESLTIQCFGTGVDYVPIYHYAQHLILIDTNIDYIPQNILNEMPYLRRVTGFGNHLLNCKQLDYLQSNQITLLGDFEACVGQFQNATGNLY